MERSDRKRLPLPRKRPSAPRKRHLQLSLDQARKPDGKHGGWRPGAGRPTKPGSNHLHLITEAADKRALSTGVQGFAGRVAHRLNSALDRKGKLFAQRYHARYLKTPREVRNALRYVLLNRKHHAAEQRFAKTRIDPFSSAAWFEGWASPIRADEPWKRELLALDRPTAKPTVWLLTTGWRKHGPLRFDERPA